MAAAVQGLAGRAASPVSSPTLCRLGGWLAALPATRSVVEPGSGLAKLPSAAMGAADCWGCASPKVRAVAPAAGGMRLCAGAEQSAVANLPQTNGMQSFHAKPAGGLNLRAEEAGERVEMGLSKVHNRLILGVRASTSLKPSNLLRTRAGTTGTQLVQTSASADACQVSTAPAPHPRCIPAALDYSTLTIKHCLYW